MRLSLAASGSANARSTAACSFTASTPGPGVPVEMSPELAAGVDRVVFDRGGYLYHGRVRALTDAARAAGLNKDEAVEAEAAEAESASAPEPSAKDADVKPKRAKKEKKEPSAKDAAKEAAKEEAKEE